MKFCRDNQGGMPLSMANVSLIRRGSSRQTFARDLIDNATALFEDIETHDAINCRGMCVLSRLFALLRDYGTLEGRK